MKNFGEFLNEGLFGQSKRKKLSSWIDSIVTGGWAYDDKGNVNVNGHVLIADMEDKYLPIKFGTVDGMFEFIDCRNLCSLEGCPTIVDQNFEIRKCSRLKNLKHSPSSCGNLEINNCMSLISLEGITDEINGNFSIWNCIQLDNLNNGPKKLKGDFSIGSNVHHKIDEIGMPSILIKKWWSSGLSLEEFKANHKGALKLNKYDL